MPNLLLDPLPSGITAGGRFYPMKTDFRTGIRFELLMSDPDKDAAAKLREALFLFFPGSLKIPPDPFSAILDFYRAGVYSETSGREEPEEAEAFQRIYDYELDAPYIVAAFQQAYGLDLTACNAERDVERHTERNMEHDTERNMHWRRFRALFRALPDTVLLVKIMQYRSADPFQYEGKQREFYQKMKRLYALPERLSQSEQTRLDAIEQALADGKSLEGIL